MCIADARALHEIDHCMAASKSKPWFAPLSCAQLRLYLDAYFDLFAPAARGATLRRTNVNRSAVPPSVATTRPNPSSGAALKLNH